MASVTKIIKETKQPKNGYVNPSSAEITSFNDEYNLSDFSSKCASPILIGTAVDYITRCLITNDFESSFTVSLHGFANVMYSKILSKEIIKNEKYSKVFLSTAEFATPLINGNAPEFVNTLRDYISDRVYSGNPLEGFKPYIRNILTLCGFDEFTRNSRQAFQNIQNIFNELSYLYDSNLALDITEVDIMICVMVKRSLNFFNIYGPIIENGFSFPGAFTYKINSGDGDFLTKDTLWDFKCSKNEPTSDHTLQLLVYYLMGLYSDGVMHTKRFANIKNLGIFNPKLNKVYIWKLYDILQNKEMIKIVGKDVIGYDIYINQYNDITQIKASDTSYARGFISYICI